MKAGNVISLGDFRDEKRSQMEERAMGDYLGVLTFGQLIDESAELLRELQNSSFSDDLTLRTSLLLNEFDRRLAEQSVDVSSSFTDMRKKIERKIRELKSLV